MVYCPSVGTFGWRLRIVNFVSFGVVYRVRGGLARDRFGIPIDFVFRFEHLRMVVRDLEFIGGSFRRYLLTYLIGLAIHTLLFTSSLQLLLAGLDLI